MMCYKRITLITVLTNKQQQLDFSTCVYAVIVCGLFGMPEDCWTSSAFMLSVAGRKVEQMRAGMHSKV